MLDLCNINKVVEMNRNLLLNFVLVMFFVTSCSVLDKKTDKENPQVSNDQNSGSKTRTVAFPKPVDTRSKKTYFPQKATTELKNLGVFVSNEFNASRLNKTELKNDSTIALYMKPENEPINNSAYYAFKIWSKKPRKIYIELNYPENFDHRYTPKVKRGEADWEYLPDSVVVVAYANRATFALNISPEQTTVAAQPIIDSKDTKVWYDAVAKEYERIVHLKSAGKSVQQRDLPVLDIYTGKPQDQKDIVVFLTRQHPPETTGFLAFKKYMEVLLKTMNAQADFLKHYRVMAFPILNPDGVDLGNWRHNAQGVDLNRDWSMYRQPEIKQAVDYILDQAELSKSRVVLGIDFHSTREDVFYTTNTPPGMIMPNFVQDWFAGLEKGISNYKVNEKRNNVGKPVSKSWFLQKHNCVGITYEMGDKTPPARILEIATVAATETVRILLEEKK